MPELCSHFRLFEAHFCHSADKLNKAAYPRPFGDKEDFDDS